MLKKQEWKRIVFSLSCVVVFVTTYMMILPAITMEMSSAEQQAGLDFYNPEKTAADLTYDEEIITYLSGPQTFVGPDFTATIDVPESALIPSDAVLIVDEIINEEYEICYAQALEALGAVSMSSARFFDIRFEADTGDGITVVQPQDVVKVIIDTGREISPEESATVLQFHKNSESGDPSAFVNEEMTGDLLIKDAPEVLPAESMAAKVSFDAQIFSVFGMACTVDESYEESAEEPEFTISEDDSLSNTEIDREPEATEEESSENVSEDAHTAESDEGNGEKQIAVGADEKQISAGTFTHISDEGDNYKIKVNYDGFSGISEEAQLEVREILKDESGDNNTVRGEFEEYVSGTERALGIEEGSAEYIRLFDINIVDENGEKVQPAEGSTVNVEIELSDAQSGGLSVVNFANDPDGGDVVRKDSDDPIISFDTADISVCAIVGTTIEKTMLASDGKNYKITAIYGPETGIPVNAELAVEEILPSEKSKADVNSAYDEYVSKTEAVLGWVAGSVSYARVFDIRIADKTDPEAKYQPKDGTSVEIRIELADAEEKKELNVVHFADAEAEGDVVENSTGKGEDGSVVEFAADGFSVYVIINHEGEEMVVTPRVEFHFIAEDFTGEGTYTASPYNFVNTAGDYQCSQILKNGEKLELITNPQNIVIENQDGTRSEKFFYGWYMVNASADTSVLDSATGKYDGTITYTWPDSDLNNVSFQDNLVINDTGTIEVGDEVSWTLGDISGTGTIDSEGRVHVYFAPLYEDFYFVNFHKGAKEDETGIKNSLVTRKLVVFGSADSTSVRIGDVKCDSPDPKHLIFAGWETVKGSPLERDQYYRTVDFNGNEEINPEGSDGYYIDITKDSSTVSQLDLYPVFDEARWLYFNTGKSGNGASYVGAAYRLTNDERQPEENSSSYYFDQSFFESHRSSRAGYDFEGWYVFANVDSDGNISNLNSAENVEITYLDDTGEPQIAAVNTKAIKVVNADGSVALPDGYQYEVGGKKIFEVENGQLRFYKALDDLTLFANWTPKTVDYTVVYWLQNADDDGYTLMYYRTEQGVAGTQTAATEIAENWTDGEGNNIYSENKLKFSHLSEDQNKEQSGNQSGIQQHYIEGDGSTIVNVYYDRDVYTLRFDIGFARKTGNSGSTTTYTTMTPEEAGSHTGTVYGLVGDEYVALTPDGNGGWTYAGTETVRHDYTDERYRETSGNDTPQYGIVNGDVVGLDLQSSTETTYIYQYTRNVSTITYTGTFYTRNGNNRYQQTSYSASNPPPTWQNNYYYARHNNGNYYYVISRVESTTTTNDWTYNNGTSYGNGTRYLRVENNDSNTTYTLGFIDGSMQTVSHDSDGWYYTTDEPASLTYSGTLYEQTTLQGTWQYSVSNTTGPNFANNDNWDTFLTQKRYDLGTTNPFSPSEYTGTYTTTVSGTDYMVYYYDLTAKYGENIMDRYPGSQSVKRNGNTSYSFVGWLAQRDSYYNARLNTSIKGYFDTMSEDLILTGGTIPTVNTKVTNVDTDDYVAITIDGDNTITHEHGITQEFRCRYVTLDNAKKYLYRVYLADPETLEYPDEPTDKFVITGGSGSYPNLQTPPTYTGYHLVDTKVLSNTGAELTPGGSNGTGSYSAYTIPELTAANVGTGMIMQFKLMPNERSITYMYGTGSVAPNTEVDPGNSSRTYYYDQSIASADVYTDTVTENTPNGYEFAGWYENPDGIGSPFNFNTTMPDGDIILYAVYKPIRYRVQINPNGGEIDHVDHTGSTYVVNGVTYATPLNREGDTGYNRSQSTYINASYGTVISEYSLERKYVPISDSAAVQYEAEGGTIYYYINTQYRSTDGSGLPSDCRNALYVKEDELQTYYDFYRDWTQANIAGGYITGTTVLDYDTWKQLYVSPQKYRTLNSNESWTFLGWFKDGDTMPYNFADPVTGEFTLTAHWRLDGGYSVRYVPEFVMPDGAVINGDMEAWRDPMESDLSYADGADTEIYKEPTGLTKDGVVIEDDSVIFLGWQLVSKSGTDDHPVYTPLEPGVYYNPSDPYVVNAANAGTDSRIYFQAVYQYKDASDRRPVVKNLTLDANTGYVNTSDSDDLPAWKYYPGINAINTEDHMISVDGDTCPTQILFGDIQSSAAVHLYQYATELTEDAAGNAFSDAHQFFTHPDGYFLLGFDDTANEGDYIATYPADSVIAITRDEDRTIYAVWEPMVYLTLKNETEAGPVTFNISSDSTEALEVINVKNGMYDRQPLSSLNNITLEDGESITLAFPKGAEKDITISGTNTLGVGKVLIWNSSVDLVQDDTVTSYATNGEDVTYEHLTHEHTLASGESGNTKPFSFRETLIVNENPLTVTFTSRNNEYALVLKDNWNGNGTGGGTQEYDYGLDDIQPENGIPKSQGLPTTSTRIGYSFVGWAASLENAAAGIADYSASSPAGSPWTIPDLNKDNGFFSTDTEIIDGVITRTLYAVWEASTDAVYVYKDVPAPGNQEQAFDFTVSITGTYQYGSGGTSTVSINESKEFHIAHGEYLRIETTKDTGTENSTAFIQSDVQVFTPVTDDITGVTSYEKDILRSKSIRWEKLVSHSLSNGFRDDLKITVTEGEETYYDTAVELTSEKRDNEITIDGSTYPKSSLPQTAETNEFFWRNTDAGGTVIYTNTRQTYDIGVEKVLHSNTAAASIFSFRASYTLDDGDPVDLGTFTVQSGSVNTEALKNVPAGAILTITEVMDTNDIYTTTVSSEKGAVDQDTENAKTFSFMVSEDDKIIFDNTIKSYPVIFRLVDQDGNTSINGMFSLSSTTGSLGTDLYASATSTNPPAGQFYSSDTFWADTYTLNQTIIPTGYIGPNGPVTLTVTGDGIESSDPENVTVEPDGDGGYIITVINRATKKVTVKKILTDPLLANTRQFGFSYSYVPQDSEGTATGETVTGDFTLAPVSNDPNGLTYELTVPINAGVTVTEKTTGNYASTGSTYDTVMESEDFTDSDDTDGSVFTVSKVEEDGTIVFTNTRKKQTVTVKKMFEDEEDATEVTFTATLLNGANEISGYQVYPGIEGVGILTTDSDGQVSFKLKHNNTQELTVPYGVKLVISETAEGYTAEIATGKEARDEDSIDNSFTMTVTDDDIVTFTNKKSGINVILKKVGADSATQEIIADHLGGAKFTVYEEDGATVASGTIEGISTVLKNLISSSEDGVFFNGVLSPGTYYLRETDAPTGYFKPAEDLRMTIAADGKVTLYAQSSNTQIEYTPHQVSGSSGKSTEVIVRNYCGYTLPSTGGPGTNMLYLLGFMLTGIAGAGLMMRKRQGNAD